MSDKPIDIDDLSDEEFLKLSEEDANRAVESQTPPDGNASEEMAHEESSGTSDDDPETPEDDGTSESADLSDDSDESDADDPSLGSAKEGDEDDEDGADGEQPDGSDPNKSSAQDASQKKPDQKPGEDAGKKGKDTDSGKEDSGLGDLTPEQLATAVEWHRQLTAPFKADGRDFQVRSVEDAVRLMQQGVNYSRRMEEIKPLRRLGRTLEDHDLADPNKLNFLIDVAKGSKQAITKLLKDHGIDPMDLDTSEEVQYQTPSYGGNRTQNEFRDALDNLVTTPEGQALVNHIYQDWDEQSKIYIRENPGTLGNLAEFKRTGVYDKVLEELNYQRAMGYLQNIPFLQAFDQVGEAMKNAGVFDQPAQEPQQGQMGTLRSATPNTAPGQNPAPVASGARKAPPPKREQPNPHLSSTPPAKQTGNMRPAETDFDKLSDEDFLKIPPPD